MQLSEMQNTNINHNFQSNTICFKTTLVVFAFSSSFQGLVEKEHF